MIFDTHAHYYDEAFDPDRDALLSSLPERGVALVVCPGCDLASSEQSVALAGRYPFLYAAAGYHPENLEGVSLSDLDGVRALCGHEKVVAVGEIGLDYFYDLSPREKQREVLIRQLDLARRLNVPAVFHVRDAHGDMLELLRQRRGELPAGVMHCYSGSVESAREYLDLGFYLSFAGPVTFKKANKLQEAARFCPADRLLVETDSPYLAPVPMRGKRNEPAFVHYVAEVVAQLRGVSTEELADTAACNACRLFGIPEE